MKMNMPVMEIIKFDSNDVIATSEGAIEYCYEYYYTSGDGLKPAREELYNVEFGLPDGDIASLKSQLTPVDGQRYTYSNGQWSECHHNHN